MIRRDLSIPKASPSAKTWFTDPTTLFNAAAFKDFLARCLSDGTLNLYRVTEQPAEVKIVIEYEAPERYTHFVGALREAFPTYETQRAAYMAAAGVVPQPNHYKQQPDGART